MTPLVGYRLSFLKAKLIMQQLWQLKTDCDENVPPPVEAQWRTFISELPLLEQIQIPRLIVPSSSYRCHLLGFSDASEKAYSAVVYLRTETGITSPKTHLLVAETNVAPLKTQSILRLELCGALLPPKL